LNHPARLGGEWRENEADSESDRDPITSTALAKNASPLRWQSQSGRGWCRLDGL